MNFLTVETFLQFLFFPLQWQANVNEKRGMNYLYYAVELLLSMLRQACSQTQSVLSSCLSLDEEVALPLRVCLFQDKPLADNRNVCISKRAIRCSIMLYLNILKKDISIKELSKLTIPTC